MHGSTWACGILPLPACLSGQAFSLHHHRAPQPTPPNVSPARPAAPTHHTPRSKMPFEPLSVSFKDICYDVPRPKSALKEAALDDEVGEGTLRLLRHVDGAFRPGVLSALMGASGAGGRRGRCRHSCGVGAGDWACQRTAPVSLCSTLRVRQAAAVPGCPPLI